MACCGPGGEGAWLDWIVQGSASLAAGHSSLPGHLLLLLFPAAPVGCGAATAHTSRPGRASTETVAFQGIGFQHLMHSNSTLAQREQSHLDQTPSS